VGVGACDKFLAAAERCATSPGVPEAASEPAPGPASELEPSPLPTPSIAAVEPSPQELAKANAYVEIQKTLVRSHQMTRNLEQYKRNTDRLVRQGGKLGDNAYQISGINDFDRLIDKLEATIAQPVPITEVDPPAARLLLALQEANPVIKSLERYHRTREFREDDHKYAQQQHPILIARMEAAIAAADGFGDALFDRQLAIDEGVVETLAKNSLGQRLLVTSLTARRAVRRYDALGPGTDVTLFRAALADASRSNRALDAALEAMRPKANTSCAAYVRALDNMIGQGRDVARDVSAGSNPKQPAERFGTYYNRSVEDFTRCQKAEERARS
ncbi:MAG: DUF3829 domain-containing protein, partial [Gemmatimonadaceae bacterium]|nr:DUF3829 domain-containing protein [Acetobacteraceae bacterium]